MYRYFSRASPAPNPLLATPARGLRLRPSNADNIFGSSVKIRIDGAKAAIAYIRFR
jgi:hypothetical protein